MKFDQDGSAFQKEAALLGTEKELQCEIHGLSNELLCDERGRNNSLFSGALCTRFALDKTPFQVVSDTHTNLVAVALGESKAERKFVLVNLEKEGDKDLNQTEADQNLEADKEAAEDNVEEEDEQDEAQRVTTRLYMQNELRVIRIPNPLNKDADQGDSFFLAFGVSIYVVFRLSI